MGFFYWPESEADKPEPGTVNMRDYFQEVGRYRGPMGEHWSPRDWKKSPTELVALHGIRATQTWISNAGLKHHRRPGARPDSGDLPWVICHRGRYYVLDGHHRAICAMGRGETHLLAHVKHPEPQEGRSRR
jgi:hypothetical protein